MLIKRSERQVRRSSLSGALADQNGGGLDRRAFLRRSGLAAGSLATLGALQLGSVRRALGWVRLHLRAVNAVGGTLVIVMGLLLLSGQLTRLNQLFNFLPLLG